MELKEIVQKLVGSITPAGEHHIDKERFENLKVLCNLVDELLYEITCVAIDNENRYEYSMKEMGKYASKFIEQIKEEY